MFGVTYKIKGQFFDRLPVQKMMADHERRALSRIGAFIRRRARSSIRRRKRTSSPGQPPSAHSTDKVATLKNILFGYDSSKKSVVVGPVLLNQFNHDWIAGVGSISIPELMEHGGVLTISEKSTDDGKTWWRRNQRRRIPSPGERWRRRRAKYRARPYMRPALQKELPNIPRIFAGRVA
jgi:hypothetical protein